MELTAGQTLLTIFAIALGAIATRFLPFLIFPENKTPPDSVAYLGRVLPPAMMGLLVVYCLKDVSPFSTPYAAPHLLAILCIILLHKWKRNVLLSIGGGTAIYMILLRLLG